MSQATQLSVINYTPPSSTFKPLHFFDYAGNRFCFAACLHEHLAISAQGLKQTIDRNFASDKPSILLLRSDNPSFLAIRKTFSSLRANALSESGKIDRISLVPVALAIKVLAFYVHHRLPRGCAQTLEKLRAEFSHVVTDTEVKERKDSDTERSKMDTSNESDGTDKDKEIDRDEEAKDDTDAHSNTDTNDGKDEKKEEKTEGKRKRKERVVEEPDTISSLIGNLAALPEDPSAAATSERVMSEYGLKPAEISESLAQQAKAFSEYRQQVWSFDRDGGKVNSTTVANNIKVL